MPPNRKKSQFQVIDPLVSINDVQSFPPLTSSTLGKGEEKKSDDVPLLLSTKYQHGKPNNENDTGVSSMVDSSSVNKVEERGLIIRNILEDERIRQMFSVENIENNLLLAPKNQKGSDESTTNDNQNDDYWDEGNTNNSLGRKRRTILESKHVRDGNHPLHSYWDWQDRAVLSRSEQKKQLVDRIIESERMRQLLSIEHVEKVLLASSKANDAVSFSEPAHDSYWHWETTNDDINDNSAEETKEEIINRILKEEKDRQLLSSERIIENVILQNKEIEQQLVPENKGYWDW